MYTWECADCGHEWEEEKTPKECPECGSDDIEGEEKEDFESGNPLFEDDDGEID